MDIGQVFLEIMDGGPGIPDNMVDKIFEPFFTTQGTGTGLGLYLARELSECNGASLEYRPAPGGGSCFRLCFAPLSTEGRMWHEGTSPGPYRGR